MTISSCKAHFCHLSAVRNIDHICSFSRRFESLFIQDCTVAEIDVFHAYTGPTLQPYDDKFSIGPTQYKVTDHGATYQERTKTWTKSSLNADYILFTVSLPGYCHCTPEDSATVSSRNALPQMSLTVAESNVRCDERFRNSC